MTGKTSRTHKAGAFDIRRIIALLLGVYGVILTIMGIGFTSDADLKKAADVNINLWSGIGLLVVTAVFVLWSVLRPLAVPDETAPEENAPAE